MANTLNNPAVALSEAARLGDIRSRVFFLIGAMIVYRIGTFIPVPGINPAQVARFFSQSSGTILGIVNMFSGGALSRLSIFAMGVMPYISASIIIHMMSMVLPSLMELRKEGQAGHDTRQNDHGDAVTDAPLGDLLAEPHQEHRAGGHRDGGGEQELPTPDQRHAALDECAGGGE